MPPDVTGCHTLIMRASPPQALGRWGELRSYSGAPAHGRLSGPKAQKHLQGYFAAVTFADYQVGRVLVKLDATRLANRTLVTLTSDHGWKLGEFGSWSKHTTFEIDLRVPLLLRHPAAPRVAKGATSEAIIELIDLYPTIAQATRLIQSTRRSQRPAHYARHSYCAAPRLTTLPKLLCPVSLPTSASYTPRREHFSPITTPLGIHYPFPNISRLSHACRFAACRPCASAHATRRRLLRLSRLGTALPRWRCRAGALPPGLSARVLSRPTRPMLTHLSMLGHRAAPTRHPAPPPRPPLFTLFLATAVHTLPRHRCAHNHPPAPTHSRRRPHSSSPRKDTPSVSGRSTRIVPVVPTSSRAWPTACGPPRMP